MSRYRVGFDSPLGVMFAVCSASGKPGKVLVVERFGKCVAKAHGFKPEEVEVLTIADEADGRVLYPQKG